MVIEMEVQSVGVEDGFIQVICKGGWWVKKWQVEQLFLVGEGEDVGCMDMEEV